MGCNLIAAAGIGCFFALINYEIASLKIDLANAPKAAIASAQMMRKRRTSNGREEKAL